MQKIHIDILHNLINIGLGNTANILNSMINTHIHLSIPTISITNSKKVSNSITFDENQILSSINMFYNHQTISGKAQFILPKNQGLQLSLNVYPDYRDKNPNYKSDSLIEIANILINNIMSPFSNLANIYFSFTVPKYNEDTKSKLLNSNEDTRSQLYIISEISYILNKTKIKNNFIINISNYNTPQFIDALDYYIEKKCNLQE